MISNIAIYILIITFIVMLYISWINWKIYDVSKKLLDVTISLNIKTKSLKEETINIKTLTEEVRDKM